MIVDNQVSIAITLGKYKDEILCDVVPMKLSIPWEYDGKVTYDGVTNKISFVHMGNKDQIKMKQNRDEEKKERKERKSREKM
ncbi:hypothetical protein CR513_17842, partial [Mucuna pruriens]